MGVDLHPCPACARHIRGDEATCPFCNAATPEGFGAVARAKIAAPMSRAAILFMGATAVSACSSSSSSGPVAAYGPAPVDSGAQDAAEDTNPVALYGPAMVDSGAKDATEEPDSGPMALYGPAPVDSGQG
jgi:hypothetical protein